MHAAGLYDESQGVAGEVASASSASDIGSGSLHELADEDEQEPMRGTEEEKEEEAVDDDGDDDAMMVVEAKDVKKKIKSGGEEADLVLAMEAREEQKQNIARFEPQAPQPPSRSRDEEELLKKDDKKKSKSKKGASVKAAPMKEMIVKEEVEKKSEKKKEKKDKEKEKDRVKLEKKHDKDKKDAKSKVDEEKGKERKQVTEELKQSPASPVRSTSISTQAPTPTSSKDLFKKPVAPMRKSKASRRASIGTDDQAPFWHGKTAAEVDLGGIEGNEVYTQLIVHNSHQALPLSPEMSPQLISFSIRSGKVRLAHLTSSQGDLALPHSL